MLPLPLSVKIGGSNVRSLYDERDSKEVGRLGWPFFLPVWKGSIFFSEETQMLNVIFCEDR